MKKALLAFVFCTALSGQAMAMTDLSLDVVGSGGMTTSTIPTGGTKPTLFAGGVGANIGMNFGPLSAGINSDMRFVNQYSEPDATVGNQRGTRWNMAAPFVAYKMDKLMARANVQFLGNYKLATATADGATLSYTSPFGGRLDVMYEVAPKISAGLYGEQVSFSKQSTTTTGETTLTTKFSLFQVGATLSYLIF